MGTLSVVGTGKVRHLRLHSAAQVEDAGGDGCRGENNRIQVETRYVKWLLELLSQRSRVGPVVRG